jgi:hypothetical protein
MTRHGKGRCGAKNAFFTNYRRKKRGLDVGGQGGSTLRKRKAWFEQRRPDGKKVDVDFIPGNKHLYV